MEEVKIKNFDKYEEYISKREEVLKILEKLDFKIEDNGLFSQSYHYIITISNERKSVDIEYSEGCLNEPLDENNATEKVISALWCILQDYNYAKNIYKDNILDFIEDFGYSIKEGKEIYKTMTENANKLLKVLTAEDVGFLTDNINL